MQKKIFMFGNVSVAYYLTAGFAELKNIVDKANAVLITDENVYKQHQKRFTNWRTIILKPGEKYKVQATADSVIEQLIEMGADRKTTLIGVGGGVITDITGYVASVYMRGISFGFVPTTLLAMVDASIGGKNGIDIGVYKNMVGVIRQPSFILHDLIFLNTLPENEWRNGFAEIIKHACIKDAKMFNELEKENLQFYQKKKKAVCDLVQRNALLKTKIVQQDEFEQGDRKLLNFGHTLGHALEKQYKLSHGQAISIGMVYASALSQRLSGFKNKERIANMLEKYGLPISIKFDKEKVNNVLKMDKKKLKGTISFILLEKIGKAFIQKITIDQLYQNL